MKIKTALNLKQAVELFGNDTNFFDPETMSYFGDSMLNYGVNQPIQIETEDGEKIMAYELFRKRPVKHGNQRSAWFDAETYKPIYNKKD